MKQVKFFFYLMLLSIGTSFAQTEYPLVTIMDIMNIPDSLHAVYPSPLKGDTVRVRGAVMVRPTIAASGDRRTILYVGARYGTYIQDPQNYANGGLNVITADTVASQATLMAEVCDTATICEFTGVVTTYPDPPSATSITELILVPNIPVVPVETMTARTTPVKLNLEDLWTVPGTTPNYAMKKYNGMYVQLNADASHSLLTSNLLTGTSSSAGKFQINDASGNYIISYPTSAYFKSAPTYSLITGGYVPPANGSYISYIRGILLLYGTYFEILPLYPGDIGPVTSSPPTIANVKRDQGIVKKNQAVTVTATIKGTTSFVKNARIIYDINGVADSVDMVKSGVDTTLYTGVIPACTADSSFVSFYVKAYDNNNLSVTNPATIATSRFSYFAFDRALTVKDVRYSPFGSGYSGYNAYKVTLNGVVVADTSDIPGNHGSNPARVYMQGGSGAWSGIMIGTIGETGVKVLNLKRGDNVTLSGTAMISSYGTKIDSLTALTVNSSNNPMPTPTVLTTGACGTSTLGILTGEPYNGSLVTYQNLNVDVANADGSVNYGESYVTDGSTHSRIIWSDGNTTFCNDGTRATNVSTGDKFTAVTGLLGYTHGYYKLCPRKNDDVVGYLSDIKLDNKLNATEYALRQNYPNPFNPATTINYSIPKTGMVTLKVYDVLGREIQTLVNQVQNNGNYKVTFNAASLPSGIYFYSLLSDNFSQVKKMILIK